MSSGCGCKEVYISSYYLSLLLLYLLFFCSSILLLVHFLKCFSFLFQYIHFVINPRCACAKRGVCVCVYSYIVFCHHAHLDLEI